jgi:hypothetical protein
MGYWMGKMEWFSSCGSRLHKKGLDESSPYDGIGIG